jgi:hypothetical protein
MPKHETRSRTKSGKFRKKRKDAGKKRRSKKTEGKEKQTERGIKRKRESDESEDTTYKRWKQAQDAEEFAKFKAQKDINKFAEEQLGLAEQIAELEDISSKGFTTEAQIKNYKKKKELAKEAEGLIKKRRLQKAFDIYEKTRNSAMNEPDQTERELKLLEAKRNYEEEIEQIKKDEAEKLRSKRDYIIDFMEKDGGAVEYAKGSSSIPTTANPQYIKFDPAGYLTSTKQSNRTSLTTNRPSTSNAFAGWPDTTIGRPSTSGAFEPWQSTTVLRPNTSGQVNLFGGPQSNPLGKKLKKKSFKTLI